MASPLNLTNDNFNFTYTDKKQGQKSTSSIFNGTRFYYRPSGDPTSKSITNNDTRAHAFSANNPNDTDLYDTTIPSLVEYSRSYPAMKLKYSDFAYLKNVGVYPNNRLIIARRFANPVFNDLTYMNVEPLATLISWVPPEDESFLNISFGEDWQNYEVESITAVFSDMVQKTLGSASSGVLDALTSKAFPMSGYSAGLQVELLRSLGITDATADNLPDGDPNIIKQAMTRKVGNSLKTKIEVKMVVEYEQKFIAKVDPTIVFLDIINNVLRFGSSNSNFILTGNGGGKIKEFFNHIRNGEWADAFGVILKVAIDVVKKVGNTIIDAIKGTAKNIVNDSNESGILDLLSKVNKEIGAATISRYRVQLNGIIAGLTGESSTPWHITIGNPKKPVFSSGDMVVTDVNLILGNTLNFNDLPSSIRVEFTLTNARPLGIQEIFERMNIGSGRSYNPIPTLYEKRAGGPLIPDKDFETQNYTPPKDNTRGGNKGVDTN